MTITFLATVIICSSVLTGNLVYASKNVQTGKGTDVTVHGAIVGRELGTIYILDDGQGHFIRADLGEHGGKMLQNTAFVMKGKLICDAKGDLVKVKHIYYQDPNPLDSSTFVPSSQSATKVKVQETTVERDPAFYHGAAASTSKDKYVNGKPVENLKDYKEVAAAEVAMLKNGSKVILTGRAVSTYGKEQINFWDTNGHNVVLIMNGAYVPLGQRCKVLGIVQNAKVNVLQIISVA